MSNRGSLVFRIGAIVNFIVSVPAVIAPDKLAPIIGLDPIQHLFLLRIWAGMAVLWGCMFWEISNDMRARRHMIKYSWIEKSVTAVSVTIAWCGDCDRYFLVFLMILFTDYLWIPLFLYYDVITRGGPGETGALAEAEAGLNA
jgi:hypothetical protein